MVSQRGIMQLIPIITVVCVLLIGVLIYILWSQGTNSAEKAVQPMGTTQPEATKQPISNLFPPLVKIQGPGMYPNYQDGEIYVIDRDLYASSDPQRGDVIAFRSPLNSSIEFIKRIIGVSGEKIKIQNGSFYINGALLKEPYLSQGIQTKGLTYLVEGKEVTVPTKMYFVVGDNRDHSSDSREWGFINKSDIVGKIGKCFQNCHE